MLYTFQIWCPSPPLPPNALAHWFAANWKRSVFCLFTPHQPGQAPQHPWSVLVSGSVLRWFFLVVSAIACARWMLKMNNCGERYMQKQLLSASAKLKRYFLMSWFHPSRFHRSNWHQITWMHWEYEKIKQIFSLVAAANFFTVTQVEFQLN